MYALITPKHSAIYQKLFLRRDDRINDILHKITTGVIEYCIQRNVKTIAIGYNKEMKQNLNVALFAGVFWTIEETHTD